MRSSVCPRPARYRLSARTNRVDAVFAPNDVSGSHIQQAESLERRRDREDRLALQLPQLLAVEIIRRHPIDPGNHQFGSLRVLPHERRRIIRLFIAGNLPDHLARALVERKQRRFFFVVIGEVDAIAVDHGRHRRAPGVACFVRLEAMRPEQVAVEVVAKQAEISEEDVEPLAVGGRSLRGKRVLDVVRFGGNAFVDRFLPAHRPVGKVDANHFPDMHAVCRRILVRVEILDVEPFSRRTAGAGVDASCEKDFAPPNDGRGPTEPRNIAFPGHVFGVRPVVGRMRVIGRCRLAAGKKAGHIEIGRDGVMSNGAVQNAEQSGDQDREPTGCRGQHDLALLSRFAAIGPDGVNESYDVSRMSFVSTPIDAFEVNGIAFGRLDQRIALSRARSLHV